MNALTAKLSNRTNAWSRIPLASAAAIGLFVHAQAQELRHAAAVIGTALMAPFHRTFWSRPVRTAFAHQIVAIAVEPLLFVGAVAAFVGISVVVQLNVWVSEAGQSQMLGPLLVAVVARELGPVLINLIVIVRSGSAMTTGLGVLKIDLGVRALEAKGNDPFLHLVAPRVLGMAVAAFCLTVVFILIAFASGFLFAAWTGQGSRNLLLFVDTVSRAIQSKDVLNILVKSILPALFAGACCCVGGLGVGDSVTDIPRATQRALTRSVAGLFVISVLVSLLTYR